MVFALGLPCVEDPEEEAHAPSLSTGAKAGIGVGAGIGGLAIIGGLWLCFAVRYRRNRKARLEREALRPVSQVTTVSSPYVDSKSKHLSTVSSAYTMPNSSPPLGHQGNFAPGYAQQPAVFEMDQPQGYGPAFGHGAPSSGSGYGGSQAGYASGYDIGITPVGSPPPGYVGPSPASHAAELSSDGGDTRR